jgi:hypothetical protein
MQVQNLLAAGRELQAYDERGKNNGHGRQIQMTAVHGSHPEPEPPTPPTPERVAEREVHQHLGEPQWPGIQERLSAPRTRWEDPPAFRFCRRAISSNRSQGSAARLLGHRAAFSSCHLTRPHPPTLWDSGFYSNP